MPPMLLGLNYIQGSRGQQTTGDTNMSWRGIRSDCQSSKPSRDTDSKTGTGARMSSELENRAETILIYAIAYSVGENDTIVVD
jgi:hypothetical protein